MPYTTLNISSPMAEPANFVNTFIAAGAQCIQAGAVSAWSWGLRSALISVGGQAGSMLGSMAAAYAVSCEPSGTTQSPVTDSAETLRQAQEIGTLCGKLVAVSVGALLLAPSQALAEKLCIRIRRAIGGGLQNNIPPSANPVRAQRMTERFFCAEALLRPPIENPLSPHLYDAAPTFTNMATVAALDVACSGLTSTLVQSVVCVKDWIENGGKKGELIPVRPVLNNDLPLLERGARTVLSGAAFDLMPAAIPILAPFLRSDIVDVITPIVTTLAPVTGTVFRLDTWFRLRIDPSPVLDAVTTISLSKAPMEDDITEKASPHQDVPEIVITEVDIGTGALNSGSSETKFN
jgi:hypothetical protein